jgi:copper chaperone CopZ
MLRRIPGVTAVYVNPANETVYVEFDGSRCSRYQIRRRLTETGYFPRNG